MIDKDHDNKYTINVLTIRSFTTVRTLLYSYKLCSIHFNVLVFIEFFTAKSVFIQEICMWIINSLDFYKNAVMDHILVAHVESVLRSCNLSEFKFSLGILYFSSISIKKLEYVDPVHGQKQHLWVSYIYNSLYIMWEFLRGYLH
jgi:hypothetical protein